MYAPAALSSLARIGSTRLSLVVTFFALSLGTKAPQLLHEMKPELPLPPFDLPRLFLFFVILNTEKGAAGAFLKAWGAATRSGCHPERLETSHAGMGIKSWPLCYLMSWN